MNRISRGSEPPADFLERWSKTFTLKNNAAMRRGGDGAERKVQWRPPPHGGKPVCSVESLCPYLQVSVRAPVHGPMLVPVSVCMC